MAAGAIAGYAVQLGTNLDQGMDIGAALTTNISGEKIIAGALITGGVILGSAALSAGLVAVGVTAGAACADRDCTNEAKPALEAITTSSGQITPKLIQGNSKMGLEHITRDHFFSSGKATDSHFLESIGVRELRDLITKASGDANSWTKEGSSLVRIIDTGKDIGLDTTGQTTTWLKVVVNTAGEVISSYPVAAPPPTGQ